MRKDLKSLKRRWEQTGDIEDEVALLIAQNRKGIITKQQIFVAALLGHRASAMIICEEHKDQSRTKPPKRKIVETVISFEGLLPRIMVSAASLIRREWHDHFDVIKNACPGMPDADEIFLTLIKAIRSYPQTEEWKALRQKLNKLRNWLTINMHLFLSDENQLMSRQHLLLEQGAVSLGVFSGWNEQSIKLHSEIALREAEQLFGEEVLINFVVEQTLPWVLGREDPLSQMFS